MTDFPRLIEHAFPLKQASLDSVHEKNVRHGHISTLHIWPARRPLAACRAALIATLLPDPSAEPKPEGMSDDQWQEEIKRRRRELCEKIGGRVVRKVEKKRMPNGSVVERIKEETEGGILHWGRETENAETLEWFRQEIRKAYGGRAPKVLDPFAGGGAIPLEAMRLGCEATASDINPVAWFILKCTLEYPQKLAGQTRPLPDFILHDDDFMSEFFKKAKGYSKAEITAATKRLHQHLKKKAAASPKREQAGLPFAPAEDGELQADLAWHVRAWGRWVLARARKDLAKFYPTYADFEPLKPGQKSYERQPMRLVPLKNDGTPDIDSLNAEFSEEYLADKRNPRWVAKPTVAYLWARTVKCKNCRATVPLLKTRWLCKKDSKRVLLTMEPAADKMGVVFGVDADVPVKGGNGAQKREHDKRIGLGAMSRAGAQCPCCGVINTMEDLKLEGKARRLGALPTAVVVNGPRGKEYRLPTKLEIQCAEDAKHGTASAFANVPYSLPSELLTEDAKRNTWCVQYGLDQFWNLFTPRQLTALGSFVASIRASRNETPKHQYSTEWIEALGLYLACGFDRMLDFNSALLSWIISVEAIRNTFGRFALPMTWDFSEAAPINAVRGGWEMCLGAVMESCPTTMAAGRATQATPRVLRQSAVKPDGAKGYDAIVTDPPYYDAIGYSVLMDFFYVWLRRTLQGLTATADEAFSEPLAPKWDHESNDGELVDDASRHGDDRIKSKRCYEEGMGRVFKACYEVLAPYGRLVVVFAHKHPDAWETLVQSMISAGFLVDGSWPIQTEQAARMRAQSSAALGSSVWLVCKKRPVTACAGWDNSVLAEMRKNIAKQLREFWDAGIRGPDFVWAATGPAMEAYSKHPVVKKANEAGGVMTVSEFLTQVRRMVVDFVVGRVLSGDGDAADEAAADKLDEPTVYYLLHRNDFGMDDTPAGTCILYAVSCGLSDSELADTWDILARVGGTESASAENGDEAEEADADDATEEDEGSGSKLRLKTWAQRKTKGMGYEAPGGKPVPLIDRVHRLMHLWKAGDVHKVDEYLDDNALRRNELFRRLLQSLIELSPHGSDERSLLESLSNHIGAKGAKTKETGVLFERKDNED